MFKTLLLTVSFTRFWSFGFGRFAHYFAFRYLDFGFSRGARRVARFQFSAFWLPFSAILLIVAACASTPSSTQTADYYTVAGKRYYPISSSTGFAQRGLASWYGGKFHGRLTSNGERYNMYGRTAAHKTLPFNTYVRVTNLQNGRKTIVRINDRGPFVRGRIIDLTYTSADELAMVEDGVVPVKIEALGYARKKREAGKWVQVYEKPASYMDGDFTIQVGAFAVRENALRLHDSLSRKYSDASVMVFDRGDQIFYRVRVGRYSRLDQAEAGAARLQEQGFPTAFAVARDK
jgi:rare lipoprotein A